MNEQILIKHVAKGLKKALGTRIGKKEFQRSKIYSFHEKLLEEHITPNVCHSIVKKLDRYWGIHTTELYPEKWTEFCAEGWPLAKRYSAIQIPHSMMTLSYVIHEHAHGVVECFLNYDDIREIKDPGHGVLWTGVFCLSFSKITNVPYESFANKLQDYKISLLDEESVLQFRELFLINKS